eukprot:3158462-Pyramimonas_sp.AAC.1
MAGNQMASRGSVSNIARFLAIRWQPNSWVASSRDQDPDPPPMPRQDASQEGLQQRGHRDVD